jgi:hypothetical protein
MDYFNAPSLDLTWGKEEHLPVGCHIWSIQRQIMLHFNYHSCPTFMTFHEFIAVVFNCVKVRDLFNTNESSIYTNCAAHIPYTNRQQNRSHLINSLYKAQILTIIITVKYQLGQRDKLFQLHFITECNIHQDRNIDRLNHVMSANILMVFRKW